ncbi:MAG TPA: methylenetetrahydrofolate reductase, partial [Stellaceae bacterium]|nr:methylenetetrahydrofolate reductase [Stellaceae bacterium]
MADETESALARELNSGHFVVTAELAPPVATDPTAFVERAKTLKGVATAVNVTDGAGAKAHLSSAAAAHFLLQAGVEPILQMTCRDRNRIALQSDMLGALALGVRNILFITGDDPKLGDQPDAKPVFDLDSRALLEVANRIRTEHRLPPGTEIKGPTALLLGGADLPIDPPAGW